MMEKLYRIYADVSLEIEADSKKDAKEKAEHCMLSWTPIDVVEVKKIEERERLKRR